VYREILDALIEQHGPQRWWPAEDPFEIMVGAVLVQRTAWRNAALAIRALKEAGVLRPDRLDDLRREALAALIRPAGFFRLKARRLQSMARFVVAAGGLRALSAQPTAGLRAALLTIRGVGPETADAILGYAFERPVFVVDAYARRLSARLAHPAPGPSDADLKAGCERELVSARDLNELHALIVRHGQVYCRAMAACDGCALRPRCGYHPERVPAERQLS